MIGLLFLKNLSFIWKHNGWDGVRNHYFNRKFIAKVIFAKRDNYIEKNYFKSSRLKGEVSKRIYFYTSAWGDYLDLFFNYGLPSILQKSNIPKLKNHGYDLRMFIYSGEEDIISIKKRFSTLIFEVEKYVKLSFVPIYINYNPLDNEYRNEFLINALLFHIKKCITDQAVSFLLPSDTIFGNKSLWNMIKLAEGKGVCVAAAHPRISWEKVQSSNIFLKLKNNEICVENDLLVDLTFDCAHPNLLRSFDNQEYNVTYAGVSIRKINSNTYAVIHNLPTVYLANFIDDDYQFFNNDRIFNDWDRGWSKILVKNSRVKVVGSSDLFFCVEMTKENVGLALLKNNLLYNDKFIKQSIPLKGYVNIYNSFCSVWRGRSLT